MSEDAGFRLGSAFVQVDPDAETFEGQLEEQLGALKYVVTIPVEADTAGLQESVDAAAAEARASIVLPVTADSAGLKESVDAASASSGAVITVPMEADPGDLAAQADAAATAAGESAGTSFADKFSSVASSTSLFSPDEGEMAAAGAAAGDAAGASFGTQFESAAAVEGAAAGEAAGTSFMSRLGSMLSGVTGMFAGIVPAAETEGAAAGEAAGAGFSSRFAAMMSGVTSAFSGLVPGMEAEGAAGGTAAGEGFATRFKAIITGSISPMEALMGAGFIAAAATMASHFQSAMELVHTQAGVAQSAISGLSGQVLTLAGQVGESPDSLAHALYHVESSFQSVGITGSAAMSLLQTAAEGARSGNANLVDVTNALDATIASGIGGINSYSEAMGALNAIVGAGDMSMQDLADAMGSGLMAVAKSYGQSIDDIGAALATFGDNNIRGAKAATDLRMAMQAILAPVKTGESYLQHLGLTMTSLGDTMTHHGLTAAIAEFVHHLEAAKVPVNQWGEYVTEIFGKKAGAGIGVLVDQLGRLQSKMPDVEKGAKDFGSAWAATQATTSQKLHELESGFQALMIRIGNGLLPAIDSLMSMITRNLPSIERLGTEIAHLAAPVVTTFFTGLETILKFLLGPMRDVTIAVGIMAAAWMALNVIMNLNPFVAIGTAIVLLTGLIVKYHKQILDTIHKYWHEIEAFLAGLAVFFPVEAAIVALVVLIVKYHKQITDEIKRLWAEIKELFTRAYDDIVKPVLKAFDDIKRAITSGFDGWWKSHGQELETVWKAVWAAIRTIFTAAWNAITSDVQTSWDILMGILRPGMDLLTAVFRTAWDLITAVFRNAWDLIAAVVKVAVAAVEAVIKVAWDLIVGIFSVFLDLITGHWSKAWDDVKNTAVQVWNAIKGFLGSVWNAIYALVVQVVNNLKNFLTSAWNDIKTGVVSAFDDVRHEIAAIWDGILHDIEAVVDKIKSVISSVVSAPGHLVSSALGAVGLARGGVIPGYAPGRDSVNARLSPGEAVLVPEAVRAIGPGRINAINAHYSAGRGGGYSLGGVVPDPYGGTFPAGHTRGGDGYAYGGIFPGGGQQPYQPAGSSQGHGGINNFYLSFAGTRPTEEEYQAIKIRLATAVGGAG